MDTQHDGIENLHVSKNLEIGYERTHHVLHCQWKGVQDTAGIVASGTILLTMIEERHITRILNDNTNVEGSWWEASDWAVKIWMPQVIQSGVRQLAWVISPNIFAELSARRVIENFPTITRAFADRETAMTWLLQTHSKEQEVRHV